MSKVADVSFSDEEKEEMGGAYFELGIHKVKVLSVEFDQTEGDDPRVFAEFVVVDPDNIEKEGKARLWFHTTGARKYSFNTIKGMFSHNAKEENKEAISKKVDAVKGTKDLAKLCEALIEKEVWYQVSEDPNRTYTKDGKTYNSYNRNVTGYEPAPAKVSAPEADSDSAPAAAPAETAADDVNMADF